MSASSVSTSSSSSSSVREVVAPPPFIINIDVCSFLRAKEVYGIAKVSRQLRSIVKFYFSEGSPYAGPSYEDIDNSKFAHIVKKVLKQALAISQRRRKTHYTFFHGMSSANGIFNWIAAQLAQSQGELSFIHALPRVQSVVDVRRLVQEGWKKENRDKDPYYTGAFHDAHYRGEILSVTPFLLDSSGAESAVYFAQSNASMSHRGKTECTQVFLNYLGTSFGSRVQELLSESDLPRALEECLNREFSRRGTTGSITRTGCGGMLAVLSVPKELVAIDPDRQAVYRSHRGGLPCECYDHSHDRDIAESFQTRRSPVLCRDKFNTGFTLQYRIIVTPEIRARMLSKVIDCAPEEVTLAWQAEAARIVKDAKKLKSQISSAVSPGGIKPAPVSGKNKMREMECWHALQHLLVPPLKCSQEEQFEKFKQLYAYLKTDPIRPFFASGDFFCSLFKEAVNVENMHRGSETEIAPNPKIIEFLLNEKYPIPQAAFIECIGWLAEKCLVKTTDQIKVFQMICERTEPFAYCLSHLELAAKEKLLKLLHAAPWPLIEQIVEKSAGITDPKELEKLLVS